MYGNQVDINLVFLVCILDDKSSVYCSNNNSLKREPKLGLQLVHLCKLIKGFLY